MALRMLSYRFDNCFSNSIHNQTQLNDTEYEMRVNKECAAFGMHTRDYLEYQSSNGTTLYLRKCPETHNQTGKSETENFFETQMIQIIKINIVLVAVFILVIYFLVL